MENYKLSIELVPRTSWCNNLRNRMSREDWDKVRRIAYREHGYKCAVCGATDIQLHCHEVWEYDDEKRIQLLREFVALCPLCHHVKHIGLAGVLAGEGKLDFRDVVTHFMKVNGCTKADFESYHQKVFDIWEERSKYQWTVDLGSYSSLMLEVNG